MDREISSDERRRVSSRRWLKAGIGVAAVAAVVAGVAGAMRKSVSASDIVIATADTGTIEITVTGTGIVSPAFEEVITSPIASRIVEVYCKSGDSVDVGTPLLCLDLQSTQTAVGKLGDEISIKQHELERQRVNTDTRLSDLEMQVRVKEMTLSRLEAEWHNEIYLDSIGSGTGDRVRQAELAVSTGRLELEQLRQQLANERRAAAAGERVSDLDISIARKNLSEVSRTLSDARVLAPRRAIVTFIYDRIGEKVSEGQKIAVVSDLGHFGIDAEISDAYANRVVVGGRAVVGFGKTRLSGTVSSVTPRSDNGVINFTVRLDDDANSGLRSGLRTDVYVSSEIVEDVVRIPKGSYYTGPGVYNMFFAEGDHLERREVRLGDSNYEFVEVESGIRPGDRVVVSDLSRYRDYSSLGLTGMRAPRAPRDP